MEDVPSKEALLKYKEAIIRYLYKLKGSEKRVEAAARLVQEERLSMIEKALWSTN